MLYARSISPATWSMMEATLQKSLPSTSISIFDLEYPSYWPSICRKVGTPLPPLNSFGAEMLNGGFSKIYVHDDRFGPYCRAGLSVVDPQRDPQHLTQQPSRYLAIEIDGRPRGKVRGAISPLYPKLRTTAREMYEAAIEIEPSLSQYIYGDLSVDVFFARSGNTRLNFLITRTLTKTSWPTSKYKSPLADTLV